MKWIITCFAIMYMLPVFSQDEQGNIDKFMKGFYAKMDTVSWLCRYDEIAWWTSDSVLASPKEEQEKLGSSWFCFEENNTWHAVYGSYNDQRFSLVYHYEVDTNHVITRVTASVDTARSFSFARALKLAAAQLEQYKDSVKVRCNQYIRSNADGTISVWLLPAFTTNGIAVYGGEFYYLCDRTGNHLLKKSEFSQEYRGFKPDKTKEIWLSYEVTDEPTLGAVFFVWYYKRYFKKIVIDARKYKSTLLFDPSSGYTWIHAVKD